MTDENGFAGPMGLRAQRSSESEESVLGLDEDESSAAEIHEVAEKLADAIFAAAEPPDPTRRVRPYRRIPKIRSDLG